MQAKFNATFQFLLRSLSELALSLAVLVPKWLLLSDNKFVAQKDYSEMEFRLRPATFRQTAAPL